MKIFGIICSLMISASLLGQNFQKGNLLIVGGGLEETNKNIYHQFIEFAGGTEKASFAIIPSASGVSVQSFVYFKSILKSYGIKPENIHLIPIAMVDDDSTTLVNEESWSKNANDLQLAEQVKTCSAVWFTGGDQMRTLQTMKNEDGSNSLVLEAVWEVFNKGGVIGGSSAGAAIMSEVMIGDGNSLSALQNGVIPYHKGNEYESDDGVLVSQGLGFFPAGIVDQHFQQRNRLGRLIVTLMQQKDTFNLGFGVDENTALIYEGSENLLRVAGTAGVTVVNTQFAEISYKQHIPHIENLRISYLEDGDAFDLSSRSIIPATNKKPTIGQEYYDHMVNQPGIFSSHDASFRDLITEDLINNKAVDKVHNISFYGPDKGFLVNLSQTPESQGFYFNNHKGADTYAVDNIRMDIVPVMISIEPLD